MARPDVEWSNAGGRVGRRENRHGHSRAAVALGIRELVSNLAPGNVPVLGLDDDAQLPAATQLRVNGQHEVALLGTHHVAAGQAGSLDCVSSGADRVAQKLFENVLEIRALGG